MIIIKKSGKFIPAFLTNLIMSTPCTQDIFSKTSQQLFILQMEASSFANRYYEVAEAIIDAASPVLNTDEIRDAKRGLVAIHHMNNPTTHPYSKLPDAQGFEKNSLAITSLKDEYGMILEHLSALFDKLSQISMQTVLQETSQGNADPKVTKLGGFSEASRKIAEALNPVKHAFYDLQAAAKVENEAFLSSISVSQPDTGGTNATFSDRIANEKLLRQQQCGRDI